MSSHDYTINVISTEAEKSRQLVISSVVEESRQLVISSAVEKSRF